LESIFIPFQCTCHRPVLEHFDSVETIASSVWIMTLSDIWPTCSNLARPSFSATYSPAIMWVSKSLITYNWCYRRLNRDWILRCAVASCSIVRPFKSPYCCETVTTATQALIRDIRDLVRTP
jgi:hypothetical protein